MAEAKEMFWGLANVVRNRIDRKRYAVSTLENPDATYQTAVFPKGFLGITNYVTPLLLVNHATQADAEAAHLQIVEVVSGNILYGLEIHPAVAVNVLTGPTPSPSGPAADGTVLSKDLVSALGQASALAQTLGNLTALIQKMRNEAHVH